jgi:hypothetical protein
MGDERCDEISGERMGRHGDANYVDVTAAWIM